MNTRIVCIDTEQLNQEVDTLVWPWNGYLACGRITLFTAIWKSGKTTLLSHLLAQRKAGGVLAGRAVAQGASAIVTEEPASLWRERHARLGFGPRNCFICRPFVGAPSPAEWLELIELVYKKKSAHGIDLAIIDPLSHFLPAGAESQQDLLRQALAPLRTLAQAGLAVLLLHHPRKKNAAEGMLSRGSGMLSSFADILIEMYRLRPDDINDRRRRLIAFSREQATPTSLGIELSRDGAAYTLLDALPEDNEFQQNWLPLRMVFEQADNALTRQEIRRSWPSSFPRPAPNTLWRWLSHASIQAMLVRTGLGTRKDPFRYALADKIAEWQAKAAAEPLDKVDAWLKAIAEKYPPPPEWEEEEEMPVDYDDASG